MVSDEELAGELEDLLSEYWNNKITSKQLREQIKGMIE